jgi:hypothetical protein
MPVQPRNAEDRLELGLRWVAAGCVLVVLVLVAIVWAAVNHTYYNLPPETDKRETQRMTSPSGKIGGIPDRPAVRQGDGEVPVR